jgi:hypothetical protein
MPLSTGLNSQNRYEIRVNGQVDGSILEWFGDAKADLKLSAEGAQMTVFYDVVMDQAGLVGLIRRLHGLGFVLLSIRRV